MKLLQDRWLTGALVIVLLLGGWYFWTRYEQRARIQELTVQDKNLQGEIAQEKERLEKLKNQLQEAGTLEFIEKQAREKLKLVRPDEVVYIDQNHQQNTRLQEEVRP